jgi:hypothetical protein
MIAGSRLPQENGKRFSLREYHHHIDTHSIPSSEIFPEKTNVSFTESLPLITEASIRPSNSSQNLLEDGFDSGTPAWGAKSRSPEWCKTLYGTSALAALVLVLNTIWTIIAVTKYPFENGIRIFYNGKCTTASRIDLVLHIVINILSTLLLGASNYAMQCLNSPTRDEVDRAHKQKEWLSIGIPSFKTLPWIPTHRGILFWLLFVTAWPLHLV